WKFGNSPDKLARLVLDGKKTATCSGLIFYELENEPLPTTEDYSIILDSKDQPVVLIKITEVSIVPMNEVTEEFALAEGEGSYGEWKEIHERFFKEELAKIGLEYKEDVLLVCERFEVCKKQ
ncbi:MAG TPA: ASCH domain-containing protein, partial [Bacillaceae bacterium]